jgi:glycosyltransferase involved in cell wall biosynthesis
MTKKINIAIDISPTFDGNSVRGVGYYTQNLVDALQKEIKINPNYKNYQIDLIRNSKLDIRNFDLIHYPYFDPFKLTLPHNSKTTVVTVHDLIPIQFKSHFPVGFKGWIKWQIQKFHLRRVSRIITVSEYSKTIISKLIKYPLKKITATHLAADSNFKPISDKNFCNSISQKYNLPPKFILFVGDINWNKNVPNLVRACKKGKYPLVIAGSSATKTDVPNHPWTKDLRWLQAQANKLKNKKTKRLILTGFVPDKDLNALFNLATVYCQPSFAEGFGLPLVQAMQSGCPVAHGFHTSPPEVMGGVGLSFNPRSVEDIYSVLKKYWHNSTLRRSQKILGLSRAKVFKWSNTAQKTLALYSSLVSNEQ